MDIYATARALVGRIGRSLVHASPVRLLLIICITIGATHSLTMLSLQYWHTILPAWAHSLTESVLLVAVLFPVIYISSFRPLVEQAAECRRAEEIMRESEHKYRQLFDCLGDGALLFDAQTGRVIDANQESERMFRRPRAEILGKRCDIFFPAEKAQEYRQRMVPRSSGTPTSFEAELQTPTGNGVPVHISVAALRLFGRDLIVILFRDMTEFKLLHADLLRAQRMDSAGKLASRIAHDLNNVLTPILVATELLSQTPREKKESNLLATIGRSTALAAQIVRQMLVGSRESKRTELDLRKLVHETAGIVRVSFPELVRIREDLAPDLWKVEADPTQLAQVLLNLALNARDAMPDGGELRFSVENLTMPEPGSQAVSTTKPGPYVVLGVADTGNGIPSEIQGRIFEPLFTTKPPGQGSGLGLAITRDIVTDHGGFIQLISQPGHGTKFRIYIPAIPPSLSERVQPEPRALQPERNKMVLVGGGKHALVGEARLALESAGYEVLRASDGVKALMLVTRHRAELKRAVLDTEKGQTAIQMQRQVGPSLKIVQVGASLATIESANGRTCAMHAVLTKPFSTVQLLMAVDTALLA